MQALVLIELRHWREEDNQGKEDGDTHLKSKICIFGCRRRNSRVNRKNRKEHVQHNFLTGGYKVLGLDT